MKVVIVGSGNVATHLALALYTAGVQVTQIWSHQYENATILASQVGAEAVEHLTMIDIEADFCLIAVKDDAISKVVKELIGFKGIVAHTSGAVNSNVFENKMVSYGVFYPLQTFSKSKKLSFEEIPLCLEANTEKALEGLTQLASKLSNQIVLVDSEKRQILHLAAVFACNFTNHLYALAEDILAAHQLTFDLLRPLINETASKVQNALPRAVQTGPAIRADEQTLKKHEELLLKQPQLLEIYKTLSESIKKTR